MESKKIKIKKFVYRIVDKILPKYIFLNLNKKIRVHFARKISPGIDKKASIYKGARISENVVVKEHGCIGFNAILTPGIVIGKHTMMGENCAFFTTNHKRVKNPDGSFSFNGYDEPKKITIGDFCWIGHNVIILGGVNIGDGVTVGAGSVVTKSVPNNCLVAGNPAVIKKKYE